MASLMGANFVGRQVELALLEAACAKAITDDRPAAALITGLPGSGKTRLLTEVRNRERSTHQLNITGYESATQVPMAAAADLLRGLGKVSGAGEMLQEFLFAPEPTVDRSLEPLRLMEAARRALLGLDGSVLLIVDDVQWVDDLSLGLCSYLIRSAEAEQKGFAVIAAGRPASAGAAWQDTLIKELGADRVSTLDLGPLERDEGVQLIRQLAPKLDAQRATELWAQAKGSPFWLGILAGGGGEHDLDANELALRVLQSPRRRLLGRDGLQELARIADASGLSEPLAVALRLAVALLATELGEQQVALDRWTSLASSVADPTLRATAYLAASRAASQIIDRKEEAFPLLDRAAHEASDDPVLEVEIESHRGRLLQVVKHRGEEGRAATFLAADKARILWGNPPVEITPRERNAYVAALQAAFDSSMVEEDGASLLRLAEEMAQVAGGSEEGPIWAAHNRSDALMFAGRVGEGLESARRAWTQARERVLPMPTLSAGPTLVSKLLDVGRLDEADEVISECLDLERRLAGSAERLAIGKVGIWSIHDLRHQIWLSRGDWRDAVASLEQELKLESDPHFRIALHWHVLVWLARCGDRTDSADIDRHFAAGHKDALDGGCRRCARELSMRAAEALVRVGRTEEAEKELHVWDEAGRGRQAHFDHALWRRHVAALIASGHSNPEIASRLFLSRKTVERHVSNILARTGARNRTDLARQLSSRT